LNVPARPPNLLHLQRPGGPSHPCPAVVSKRRQALTSTIHSLFIHLPCTTQLRTKGRNKHYLPLPYVSLPTFYPYLPATCYLQYYRLQYLQYYDCYDPQVPYSMYLTHPLIPPPFGPPSKSFSLSPSWLLLLPAPSTPTSTHPHPHPHPHPPTHTTHTHTQTLTLHTPHSTLPHSLLSSSSSSSSSLLPFSTHQLHHDYSIPSSTIYTSLHTSS
jgi:hypothetical protein